MTSRRRWGAGRPRRARRARWAVSAGSAILLLFACGGIRTVSRDGYRATLVYSPGDKYRIAVRGEWRRVDGEVDGAPLVKIMRPDLKRTWQFRPRSKRILDEAWSPTDEIVPGFPLEPRFDEQAYASRFKATVTKIADGAFGGHPCDRYQMDLPSDDRVVIWAARDLERLPIRIEHFKKRAEDDYQPFLEVQLSDIRVGADEDLFEKPKGYKPVASYEELRKAG
jgi:hypothetical protein